MSDPYLTPDGLDWRSIRTTTHPCPAANSRIGGPLAGAAPTPTAHLQLPKVLTCRDAEPSSARQPSSAPLAARRDCFQLKGPQRSCAFPHGSSSPEKTYVPQTRQGGRSMEAGWGLNLDASRSATGVFLNPYHLIQDEPLGLVSMSLSYHRRQYSARTVP
jgi:hypothetical protein